MGKARQRLQHLVSFAVATAVVGGSTAAHAAATDYTFVMLDIQADIARANGINNFSQIVGSYSNVEEPGTVHGFVLADTLSSIDVPDVRPNSTRVDGINDNGDLVGSFLDPLPPLLPKGFLYRDGFQLFRFAPAVEVLGINNDGWMVGRCFDGIDVITCVLD